jgi:hypothetical protein
MTGADEIFGKEKSRIAIIIEDTYAYTPRNAAVSPSLRSLTNYVQRAVSIRDTRTSAGRIFCCADMSDLEVIKETSRVNSFALFLPRYQL